MQELITLTAGLAIAVPLAIALPLLIWAAYTRLTVGLVLVLTTFFLEVVYVEYPGLWVGIYLYPSDLVFLILAVPATLRLLFAHDFPGRSLPWLLFGVMIGASFAVGLSQFGRAAGTDFRNYFYVWVCALYFMSFPIDEARMKSILRTWLLFSGLLVALAAFRGIAEFAGMPIASTWRGTGAAAVFRVLPSGATLFLLNTLLILMYAVTARSAKRWMWIAVPVLIATVLIMQHRSVWIAAGVAIVMLYLVFPGRVRLKLARPLLAGTFALALVGGGFVGYGKVDGLMYSVTQSASTATDLYGGTGGGRLYGWGQLLDQLSPEEYLTGKPFGSGYERYEFPNVRWKATWDPHNFYVQTLLRTGIPGLALLLGVYALTLRRLLRDKGLSGLPDLPPRLLFVMLAAQIAFIFAYRLPYEQAIWIGLAISMAASLARPARTAQAVADAAPARAEAQPT
jgi:O-antigen ligase